MPLILITIRYTLYYRFGNLTLGASNTFVHAFDPLIYDIKYIECADEYLNQNLTLLLITP